MLIYNDETVFGTNEKGDAIVFDWAHECGFYPKIRVEAVRTYVERAWTLNRLDKKAVKAKFDIERTYGIDKRRSSSHGFRLQSPHD